MTDDRKRTDSVSWVPLVAICLGYFMVILDVTVVTVAVPAIGAELHASVTGLQWVVDGYTLVFAGLLLFSGGLGDRLGSRPIFIAGLITFTLASAGCGLAPSTMALIGARLVQGIGAAMMVPTSLALLQATYSDRAARARAFGVWGMVSGIAAGAGPVISGLLVASSDWRAVFFLNLPIGVAALLLTVRYVPAPAGRPQSGLDIPAQTTAVLCLVGLTTALNEAGSLGWLHPVVLGGFTVFVLALVAFLMLERRAIAPMLPLPMFRAREFSASTVIGLLLNMGFYGLLFVAPLYFQRTHHYGPLETGLALLPAMGVVALSSALAGQVTARTGPRLPMVVGLLAGGLGLLGWLIADAKTPYLLLIAPMIGVGFGAAFTMPASTAAIMEAAPADRGGAASAVFNAARQVGSAVGVALLGTLVAHRFISGLHTGVAAGGIGFLAASIVAAVCIRPPRRTA